MKVCDPMYKGIYGANYNRISVVFADGEIGVVDYDNNVIFKTPGRGLLTYTGVDGYMTYTDMDRRVRIVDYNGKEVGRFPEKVSANKVGEGDFFYSIVYGGALNIVPKFGIVDTNGQVVIPAEYTVLRDNQCGLRAAIKMVRELALMTYKAGFVNDNGEEVIPLKYYTVESFHNGLARVGRVENNVIYYGMVDTSGNEVVPLIYTYIDPTPSDGLYLSSREIDGKNLYGYLDEEGSVAIPHEYAYAARFSCGLAAVQDSEHKSEIGFIDTEGKLVIPFIEKSSGYKFTLPVFSEDVCVISIDGKLGVIDKTGALVAPCIFDTKSFEFIFNNKQIIPSVYEEGKVALRVKKGGKYGIFDKKGNAIVEPIYDAIVYEKNSKLYIVKSKGKWGFLDSDGTMLAPAEYDNYIIPNNQVLIYEKDKKRGFMKIVD